MKKLKIDELNTLYEDSKTVDREALAEMRSNILLIAGEHYSRKMTEWWNRTRTNQQVTENYKIRITKNWLHRAHRLYMSSILSKAPGTKISPRNPTELQDQKDAELNQAVWEYAKNKYKMKPFVRNMVSDFCGVGECATKIFFDPNKGYLKGYEPKLDEQGQPLLDEKGQPVPDEARPVFSGEFVFERIYAHTLFRNASAKQMSDSDLIGIEKMEKTSVLRKRYDGDKEKLKYIDESKEDFVVFDSNKNGYEKSKDQTLLREYYFKPSSEIPDGYYYIATKTGILEEGPLPKGIFPIVWKGFDEHPTKARATSMVKVGRPFQAEINRASSQVALHQITLGEDKILYQSGSKLAQGNSLPGVRGLTFTGTPPTVLPGRSGDQFYEYISQQKSEMDQALLLDLLDQEKVNNLDPYSLLFRAMKETEYFSLYSEKFGEFLVEMTEVFLELAKYYLPDDEVVAAIGKSEAINLEEFRKTTPLCHQVIVEEAAESTSTLLGRQLTMNHFLQYVGPQLSREDIGKLLMNSPFGNWQDQFADFTINERNCKNDFLAMERGQMPPISARDDSDYILSRVASRKKERDFQLLSPQVQQLYEQYEQFHLQKVEEERQAKKQAESEFIPVGGAMVACDIYLPPEDPAKAPKRARVPYQALEWLLQTLDQQGMSQDKLENMNQSQLLEAMRQLPQGGMPQAMPALQQGAESPMGVMQ
jgi:hypothetical protein